MSTQRKCIWYPQVHSISNAGTCELNDYFVLTLRGTPPSISGRILVFLQYKANVCASYSSEAACVGTASDACAWDRSSGGSCYLSFSAAFDPEILRDHLYCDRSLLDAAARCALAPPTGGSEGCSAVSGADCTFLSTAKLADLGLTARTYLRLTGLVTYTTPDLLEPPGGGLCVPKWLQQANTLDQLQRSVAANPKLGLLQPDLVGTCSGTDTLVRRLATAADTCAAAAAATAVGGGDGGVGGAPQFACAATSGCDWDEGSGVCEPGLSTMYDVLFDTNDAWVRAFTDAYDSCAAATSNSACEAAGGSLISVDTSRMSSLRNAMTDPDFSIDGDRSGGQGGSGTALAGGWLALIISVTSALAVTWGLGGVGGFLGS